MSLGPIFLKRPDAELVFSEQPASREDTSYHFVASLWLRAGGQAPF
jgi:hypothetical protein